MCVQFSDSVLASCWLLENDGGNWFGKIWIRTQQSYRRLIRWLRKVIEVMSRKGFWPQVTVGCSCSVSILRKHCCTSILLWLVLSWTPWILLSYVIAWRHFIKMYWSFNQFTLGILLVFPVPHTGLFSVKNLNKFRELNGNFFYFGHLSSAQLLSQRPIIDQALVEQTAFPREIKDLVTMDINPSLQILGWYVKGTVLG